MTIGYDGYEAFFGSSEAGYAGRQLMMALSEAFPNDKLFVYLTEIKQSRSITHILSHANIRLKTPNKSYSKWWWRNMGGMYHEFRRHHVKVFHSLDGKLPLRTKSRRVKLVVSLRDVTHLGLRQRMAARKAQAVIVPSQWAKEQLLKRLNINPDKVNVVYCSCRDEYYTLPTDVMMQTTKSHYKLPTKFILTTSSFGKDGNLATLVKALPLLDDKQVKIVLVGDKTEGYEALKQLSVKLGLRNRLVRLSRVKSDYFPSLYRHAAACVHTTVNDATGLPVMEALASSTPIVAADSGCAHEVGNGMTRFFAPGDERQLADILNTILADDFDRETACADMADQARLFSPREQAEQVRGIYEKLV